MSPSVPEDQLVTPVSAEIVHDVLFERLRTRALKLDYLGGGSFSAYHVVDSDHREYVLRFPKFTENLGAIMEKEQRLASVVAPCVAPHELTKLEEILPPSADSFGGPVYKYQYLNGAQVARLRLFESAVANEPKLEKLAVQLGDFLRKLHGVALGDVVAKSGVARASARNIVQMIADDAASVRATIYPVLNEAERAWAENNYRSFFEKIAGREDAIRPSLVHGDFGDENVLVPKDFGYLQVVDLEDMRVGDPAVDFCSWLPSYGDEFVRTMLSQYSIDLDPLLLDRARFYIAKTPFTYFKFGIENKNEKFIAYARRLLRERMG